MSDQSKQSDYDRQVKTILDRVAAGHLSAAEAATLIAALPNTSAAPADSATAGGGSASGGQSASSGAAGSDVPSPSVWAEAVDSPAPGAWPGTSSGGAAAGSAGESAASSSRGSGATSAEPTPAAPAAKHAASNGEGSVVDDAAVVPEAERAPEPTPAPTPSPEPVVVVEETLHSDLVVPSGVRRVTIRAIGRRVRLVGEPAVTGVAVDGPHVIKRDGDTLAINSEGDMGVSIDGLNLLRNPTDLKSHVNGLAKELWIRVNPMLQVEIEVTGGSVTAERLPGLSRVRVTAGTAKVTDVDGPIDVLVQAGTATLDAQITKGRSRVRVESGSANVTLRRGSDVRVHTEAQLGRVSWTGAVSGQSKDVEIGRGRAALDVEVLVGSAQITSD
jgi:hypothetical protein